VFGGWGVMFGDVYFFAGIIQFFSQNTCTMNDVDNLDCLVELFQAICLEQMWVAQYIQSDPEFAVQVQTLLMLNVEDLLQLPSAAFSNATSMHATDPDFDYSDEPLLEDAGTPPEFVAKCAVVTQRLARIETLTRLFLLECPQIQHAPPVPEVHQASVEFGEPPGREG
jgi:hypothetical protein